MLTSLVFPETPASRAFRLKLEASPDATQRSTESRWKAHKRTRTVHAALRRGSSQSFAVIGSRNPEKEAFPQSSAPFNSGHWV